MSGRLYSGFDWQTDCCCLSVLADFAPEYLTEALRSGREESRRGCGLCRKRQPGAVQEGEDTDIVREERASGSGEEEGRHHPERVGVACPEGSRRNCPGGLMFHMRNGIFTGELAPVVT